MATCQMEQDAVKEGACVSGIMKTNRREPKKVAWGELRLSRMPEMQGEVLV